MLNLKNYSSVTHCGVIYHVGLYSPATEEADANGLTMYDIVCRASIICNNKYLPNGLEIDVDPTANPNVYGMQVLYYSNGTAFSKVLTSEDAYNNNVFPLISVVRGGLSVVIPTSTSGISLNYVSKDGGATWTLQELASHV